MNGDSVFAVSLVRSLTRLVNEAGDPGCDVLLCPPAPLLQVVREAIGDSCLLLAGQDCHFERNGAYTGDVSAAMLADLGCSHVVVGHSERRTYHGEDDARVCAKAAAAQAEGLVPIVCVGETLDQREAGQAREVIEDQVSGSVPQGSTSETVVIAYEPVWAIGTGKTPSPAEIADIHDLILSVLSDREARMRRVRILYGGSVNSDNARSFLSIDNVGGALVGGASLEASRFWSIVRSCPEFAGGT